MNQRLVNTGISGLLDVVLGCLDVCSMREKKILELNDEILQMKQEQGIETAGDTAGIDWDFNHRKGVIIVDHNQLARRSLQDLFKLHGIKVLGVAENGKNAIELYRLHHPAAITMEMDMPGMNGYETALKIKQIDPYANIIFVSRVLDRKQVMMALQCGAVDYLAKPVETSRLVDLINRILDKVVGENDPFQ
ncbi:MAG TPA: response regulator [Firmicutes bacterium]|nr:response regulator [Bacillota bacterium]